MTVDELISELRKVAKDNCEGCDVNWSLERGVHREPSGVPCSVPGIRAAMRELNMLPRKRAEPDETLCR